MSVIDLRRPSQKNSPRILVELDYETTARVFSEFGPIRGNQELILSDESLSKLKGLQYNVLQDERDGDTIELKSEEFVDLDGENEYDTMNSSDNDEEPTSDTFLCEEEKSNGEPCERTVSSPDETCFQH
jgi:hypothetical protein